MSGARRALQSVTCYKPEKAYNGFTLFAPMTQVPSNVWLMDMQGRFLHRWQLPGWIRQYAQLLQNGNILFGIRDPESSFADLPFAGGGLMEMDWDGNILWKYDEPYMDCHDWIRLKNGNTMIAKYVPIPKAIAARVKGGLPRTERNGVMWGYVLQEITTAGKVVKEIMTYKVMDPDLDSINPLWVRLVWPGWNSLLETPEGDIMACSFATDNIVILDRGTGKVKWRWGKGTISFAHNPSILDNGNILVLDNGRYHTADPWPPDNSRVIEVNPKTGEIAWEYREENPVDFYTTYIGSCQRLPNGNTLICEGAMGRLLEVTAKGELVWEYIVPFYNERPEHKFGRSNCTYRCRRFGPDYPGLQGKKLTPEKLDLWNRLYGPEAFMPWVNPAYIPSCEKPAYNSDESGIGISPKAKYIDSAPSVSKPSADKKKVERSRQLGY
ncbi:aryl-sulfate sulfotransferase [Chloroflexota bacterium]